MQQILTVNTGSGMRLSAITIVAWSLLIAGSVHAQDRYNCDAIIANVETNNAKVRQLATDKGLEIKETVVAGLPAGLPVVSFRLGGQSVEDKDIAYLYRRQHYLADLADQRRCGGQPPR